MQRFHGYDLDDIPGDIPRISDAEIDALIDARQQHDLEEMDLDRINGAILKVNRNMK